MLIVEPYDEIQVFIRDTGCCLWGDIQPESGNGNIVLQLTVEPLADTVQQVAGKGVCVLPTRFMERPLRLLFKPNRIARGALVVIPREAVDVIFGDERHDDEETQPEDVMFGVFSNA